MAAACATRVFATPHPDAYGATHADSAWLSGPGKALDRMGVCRRDVRSGQRPVHHRVFIDGAVAALDAGAPLTLGRVWAAWGASRRRSIAVNSGAPDNASIQRAIRDALQTP